MLGQAGYLPHRRAASTFPDLSKPKSANFLYFEMSGLYFSRVKGLIQFTFCFLLFGLTPEVDAAFSALYVFGDTVSSTSTNHASDAPLYFGKRFSNGRIWVELLAQQLNLTNNYWYSNNPSVHLSYTNLSASSTNWSYTSNDISYFDHNSSNLVKEIGNFVVPSEISNDLFIVWVCDADLYDAISVHNDGTDTNKWNVDINLSMTNHWTIITNLYSKGVRALLMPNAVDMSRIPAFDGDSRTNFFHQESIHYNAAFGSVLSNATALIPNLKIYSPDFFSLLNNVLANPASYGVTNALQNGHSIDALEDLSLTDYSLNGPGASYIFWDYLDPTAKVHAIMADTAKQLIAPVQIRQVSVQNGTNQLNLINVPVGLNGLVQGSASLALTNWITMTNFNSTDSVLSVSVPVSGPMQFYRLAFPYAWTWP